MNSYYILNNIFFKQCIISHNNKNVLTFAFIAFHCDILHLFIQQDQKIIFYRNLRIVSVRIIHGYLFDMK